MSDLPIGQKIANANSLLRQYLNDANMSELRKLAYEAEGNQAQIDIETTIYEAATSKSNALASKLKEYQTEAEQSGYIVEFLEDSTIAITKKEENGTPED